MKRAAGSLGTRGGRSVNEGFVKGFGVVAAGSGDLVGLLWGAVGLVVMRECYFG